MELITRALDIYSDLDEGEIVDVEIVSGIIFELVEALEVNHANISVMIVRLTKLEHAYTEVESLKEMLSNTKKQIITLEGYVDDVQRSKS